MDPEKLKEIMEQVRSHRVSPDEAVEMLRDLPYKDLGHSKIDNHRSLRTGYPEVIFCEGKSVDQVNGIVSYMAGQNVNVLGTRASREQFESLAAKVPEAEYHETARCITVRKKEIDQTKTSIAVLTAGTSDQSVAEEAAVTAEMFGNRVERYFDVGVAGIHRLYANLGEIRESRVIIVIAGMEGALPSIVGGLVDRPVIAVPTSVGYGASFNGLAALLGMLTSCASGVTVVNIDNGYGAAYMASMINKI